MLDGGRQGETSLSKGPHYRGAARFDLRRRTQGRYDRSMNRFPREFADLLAPRGRRILDGRVDEWRAALADPARPFVAIHGAIDAGKAHAMHGLLERRLGPVLVRMEAAIPPGSIWNQTRNYQERLPKTARVSTAYLERRRGRAWDIAEATGLLPMLRSESYRAFAETLAGRALAAEFGQQVLCYGQGDYAGPHTDHHPEDPRAAGGYVDMHVSVGHPAIAHQYLIYAREGHFSEMVDVARPGTITAYRLPFWHYTTPLLAKRGREDVARRWVVLGTFLYAEPNFPIDAPINPARAGGTRT